MNKGWIILQKKEMTSLWVDDKLIPVTLLKLLWQEIIRYKTIEKDWYSSVLIWVWKKKLDKEKWIKIKFDMLTEFKVNEDYVSANEVWKKVDISIFDDIDRVSIKSVSKWKWFQWVMKRHNFAWWPATHGSKFHRLPGSVWNRKPRRVNKGHPLPGRMWWDSITLKKIPLIDKINVNWEDFIAVKWAVPWAYNCMLKVVL
jgi:large subunit ribosomal protein L3